MGCRPARSMTWWPPLAPARGSPSRRCRGSAPCSSRDAHRQPRGPVGLRSIPARALAQRVIHQPARAAPPGVEAPLRCRRRVPERHRDRPAGHRGDRRAARRVGRRRAPLLSETSMARVRQTDPIQLPATKTGPSPTRRLSHPYRCADAHRFRPRPRPHPPVLRQPGARPRPRRSPASRPTSAANRSPSSIAGHPGTPTSPTGHASRLLS